MKCCIAEPSRAIPVPPRSLLVFLHSSQPSPTHESHEQILLLDPQRTCTTLPRVTTTAATRLNPRSPARTTAHGARSSLSRARGKVLSAGSTGCARSVCPHWTPPPPPDNTFTPISRTHAGHAFFHIRAQNSLLPEIQKAHLLISLRSLLIRYSPGLS